MKLIYLMLSILFIASCTSSENKNANKEQVSSLIFPMHPVPLKEKYMGFQEKYVHSFIDTNGNQYVTEWLFPSSVAYNQEVFLITSKKCSTIANGLYPKILNDIALENSISVYNSVILCFIESGFELKKSEAFYPESVVFALSKNYSLGDQIIGAGGSIVIDSKMLEIKSILPYVTSCMTKHHDTYLEGFDGGFIYIDLQPMLNKMVECLQQNGLIAKRIQKQHSIEQR